MNIWTTKEGKKISYVNLEDSHLLNILKWIEKVADTGVVIQLFGCDWDEQEEVIYDEDVFEHYDYHGLLKEVKRRNLIENEGKAQK